MGVISAAPSRPLPPHPPTESGRKSNLKRKHTQTHTNKYRDSNNHKPRNLSHNFPKESKIDQQTRKAKLSVMTLRLVWVSFHCFLVFFLFPGLVMNEDRGGLVWGVFFFGWFGFGFFFFFLILVAVVLVCFGYFFSSNAVLREALTMGLVCAGRVVRVGPVATARRGSRTSRGSGAVPLLSAVASIILVSSRKTSKQKVTPRSLCFSSLA